MIYITYILALAILYLIITFFIINKKFTNIIKINNAIEHMLNTRFKYVETIISRIPNKVDYEETTFKEIVQLRSQALKFKETNDKRAEYFCELKISQMLDSLELLINEFEPLKRINIPPELKVKIENAQEHLKELEGKHNRLVSRYNYLQTDIFFLPIVTIFKKYNINFEERPQN